MTELETLQARLAALEEENDAVVSDHRHAIRQFDAEHSRLHSERYATRRKIYLLTASDNHVNV
jgi:hypothetical protein